MREQLENMGGLVEKNLAKTQYNQKQWYNRCACQQRFKTGDQVLVLLSKLTARWQGPYEVVKPVRKVNYLANLPTSKRSCQHVEGVVHPIQYSLLCSRRRGNDKVLKWRNSEDSSVQFGKELVEEQQRQLEKLLGDFTTVMNSTPGSTSLAKHPIETGDARPVPLQFY